MDFLDQYPTLEEVGGGLTLSQEDTKKRYENQPSRLEKYEMNLEGKTGRSSSIDPVAQQTWEIQTFYKWRMAIKVPTPVRWHDDVFNDLLRGVSYMVKEVVGTREEFIEATGRVPGTWDISHQIPVMKATTT